MKIPANVSGLKSKLSGAFTKKPEEQPKTDELSRRSMSIVAQEKAKRKALADELANEKTTSERRQQIIDELQAQVDAKNAELETIQKEYEALKPQAKAWEKHEHIERTKLIEKLPAERKSRAKDLPLDLLREFVSGITGSSNGEQQKKETGSDWASIMATNDGEKIANAIESDPQGYNDFMDKGGK